MTYAGFWRRAGAFLVDLLVYVSAFTAAILAADHELGLGLIGGPVLLSRSSRSGNGIHGAQ